ncbi:MAG: transcription termination factor Rho [Patescibacteria group bacterium]|nr:transcription termination factor Rho [Patescibacteria group bacterium]
MPLRFSSSIGKRPLDADADASLVSGIVGKPAFNNNNNGPRDLDNENIQTMNLAGVLDIQMEGHGYLRPKFIPSDKDVYISSSQIRRFNLRAGDWVEGVGRPPKETERYHGLLRVDKVNGMEADKLGQRPWFDDLIPIYPDKQLTLETGATPLSTRIIDLIAPIGRGQRGLIVSPPKAGKTWLLKEIANGITTNFPDYHLMVALVGERPEEVTDISRGTHGEVIASNFDQSPQEQVRVAEVTLERAKRLVEMGKNVVILLDSITRLARAYNLAIPPSGRTLSGGFDPAALFPPKQFLGAARCVEDGGSLTILGTALVNTDSRMDDLIYEEFKGTGNMELHLDRRLSEKRIFPAIDVGRSGTRNFERLVDEKRLKQLDTLIKMLHLLSDDERTEMLVERLTKTKSNAEFLESLSQGA